MRAYSKDILSIFPLDGSNVSLLLNATLSPSRERERKIEKDREMTQKGSNERMKLSNEIIEQTSRLY